MPIDDPELEVIAVSFQSAANEAFNNAADEKAQENVVRLLNETMRSYTREWRAESGQGCPDGWTECPDGSCVPDSSSCGGSLSFEEVTAYIAEAASAYFASAESETLQSRTRELLQAAQQSFKAQLTLEVQ